MAVGAAVASPPLRQMEFQGREAGRGTPSSGVAAVFSREMEGRGIGGSGGGPVEAAKR